MADPKPGLFQVEGHPGKIETVLGDLGLASAPSGAEIRIWSETAEGCFSLLFAAAARGGAYSAGDGGAYGRLDAWESMAALVGLPETAPIEQEAKEAEAADWLRFTASIRWFFGLAWDAAIVCRRRGGTELAVVAATDDE